MSRDRCRSAFTLIEVLIVVVIMAVLAATIIPQFSSSTRDAQDSSLRFNQHTMRSQIELFKLHHLGKYPEVDANGEMPQLTQPTDAQGNVGSGPYGPYMDALPVNPFNDKSTVKDITGATEDPTTGDDSTGWQYNPTTGGFWPNHGDWKP
jgi:prepilin-type N-terminal cleavage/methylation domain-containing protein